ncbi:MAG: metal ABC transporter permease [Hyphomicrobiales bacterium]|nr:metal ABC transporter permease [Hyphomicrobiales bacterium]
MLYDLVLAPFADFGFMRRALVGVIALALGAGPIGIFLMLRRMSLMGDAMAHAILPGAAIGYLLGGLSLGFMTAGGLVAGFAVALLAGALARVTVLREDATLASFYLLSLAGGVVLLSVKGSNLDLLHVLFGSVLALDDATLVLLVSASSISLIVLALIFRPLVLECVDPVFLASVNGHGGRVHLMFLGLLTLNLVAGFHALGTLLAVGLMMLPAVAARFWCRGIGTLIVTATGIGMLSGLIGILLSYHSGLPTGVFYAGSILFGPQGGLLLSLFPRSHLRG